MKRLPIIIVVLLALAALLAGCNNTGAPSTPSTPSQPTTPAAPTAAQLSLGGKLYDSWMKAANVATPAGNSPLWSSQTTNTRTGADTWRCKECHGWDYKGKDGAYGKGSHATGFPGVFNAATTKTTAQLESALKGSPNANHNFSTYLNADQISALAAFLKNGAVTDMAQYIDYTTKKPKSADAVKGKTLYDTNCSACHGADGKLLNFGDAAAPEFVGTIAVDNPWEFFHKTRFGQPGNVMPSGVEQGWTIQQMMDILAHSQTLPK